MERMTAREAAERWGVSVRYVQTLCKNGRIAGAERFSGSWMIPGDTPRPPDGRSRIGKAAKADPEAAKPLLRKTPFLDMTDLYSQPGTADQCIRDLAHHPEAQALFAAKIAYSRGDIYQVYHRANYFLESHSGFYAVLSGGMLLCLCAMWTGDLYMWRRAKKHILEAPCRNDVDRDIVQLTLAAADSAIRNTDAFPDWFVRGCFDNLPRDAHPAARVYYCKHLLIYAQDLMLGKSFMDGISGFAPFKLLPLVMEPMISQMVADRVIMAQIYLRLMCAIAYHQGGNDDRATEHLDKAIVLCLPDRLYGPLVEFRRQLGSFLDDRLAILNPEALKEVKQLHKQLLAGWTKLHNAVLNRQVQASLTNREREVARLAAFGMTDSQIAARLHISESSVKTAIRTVKNKTGTNSRKELAVFV